MYRWLAGLAVGLLLVAGCARTVTQYVTYGDQLVVEVVLRGTMEVSANRYFLVLASNSNYKVPLPPPENISYEFIEPGTEPRLGSMADYFTNFYASWEGYCAVDPGGFFSVKGPFVLGTLPTREVISALGDMSTKIRFVFRLDRVFASAVPSTIYFDFVSVPWPADSSKLPADHLTATNAYLSKVSGSTITVDDEENTSLAAALDILKCTVTIQ